MRESDRLGSLWVREGGRLKKKGREIEREKREGNRCAKIVSYNEYELSVGYKCTRTNIMT